MHGQGRPRGWFLLSLLIVIAVATQALSAPSLDESAAEPAPPSAPASAAGETSPAEPGRPAAPPHADADLHDVFFVDPQCGWAVGDRGTILHTLDGGRTWSYQNSGVDCRLQSVHFIDARTGWAAGERFEPYNHLSSGILLYTTDGGATWTREGKILPAGLFQVRFRNARSGWAVGRFSAMYPAGIALTEDGGKTWMPQSSKTSSDWLCGDLHPSGRGIVGGQGAAGLLDRAAVTPVADLHLGLRAARNIRWYGPIAAWMVGDAGLLLHTGDSGQSWQSFAANLPAGMAEQFDFAALEVHGANCWIAGSPGTAIFHSADSGKTWSIAPTGQNMPVASISFADARHGWAVGAHGTILATSDGGRRWHVQRSAAARAALLALCGDELDVPLEAIAACSADGYICRAEIIGRRDVEVPLPEAARRSQRVHDAVVASGGTGSRTSSMFPLRQARLQLGRETILQGWNWAHNGAGLVQLESHLVRQIRIWRPDVIVTQDAGACEDPELGRILNELIAQAVQAAADPEKFPEHYRSAGLSPWQVKRVLLELPAGERGSVNVAGSETIPLVGTSLADLYEPARRLLVSHYTKPAQSTSFRIADGPPGEVADFFTGLSIPHRSDARRPARAITDDVVAELEQQSTRQRSLQGLLEHAAITGRDTGQAIGQISNLTRHLPPDASGDLMFQLGSQYYGQGRWDLAAQAMEGLAKQHPDHRLSTSAMIWLVQYYSSAEAAHRTGGPKQNFAVRQATHIGSDQLQSPEDPTSPDYDPELLPAEESNITQQSYGADRTALAAYWSKQLEKHRPTLLSEPNVGFPLAAASRILGPQSPGERFYASVRRNRPHDAWWNCAVAESAFSTGATAEAPGAKPVWRCLPALEKPYLDGKLNDLVWQSAEPVELRSKQGDDASWTASAKIAYDPEFLYFSVTCKQAAGTQYSDAPGPRPRDADLSPRDRVDLFIDLDRDWTTYYQLTVDHNGWTSDACWHDASWNPNWFVAAATVDGTWTVEAAIPLAQLSPTPPTSAQPWAVGVQRTVPGTGFQSWTTPASTEVIPQGFGHLVAE